MGLFNFVSKDELKGLETLYLELQKQLSAVNERVEELTKENEQLKSDLNKAVEEMKSLSAKKQRKERKPAKVILNAGEHKKRGRPKKIEAKEEVKKEVPVIVEPVEGGFTPAEITAELEKAELKKTESKKRRGRPKKEVKEAAVVGIDFPEEEPIKKKKTYHKKRAKKITPSADTKIESYSDVVGLKW